MRVQLRPIPNSRGENPEGCSEFAGTAVTEGSIVLKPNVRVRHATRANWKTRPHPQTDRKPCRSKFYRGPVSHPTGQHDDAMDQGVQLALATGQRDGLWSSGRLRIDANTDRLTGVRVSIGYQPVPP